MQFKKLLFPLVLIMYLNSFSNSMRVITYNLNSEIKWNLKKYEIYKLLKELDADIICLQEVTHKNHAKLLAHDLKMNWNKKSWHIGGMTILSKFKILKCLKIDIPNSYFNALVAIQLENDIWVVSIHLSSLDYKINDIERLRELNFILNKLDDLNAKQIIIGGDFNSLDNSEVSNLLINREYIDTHKDRLWAKSTWMPSSEIERIDRIYVRGNFKIMDGKIIDHNDIKWLESVGWPTGNDHRLVLTDLLL